MPKSKGVTLDAKWLAALEALPDSRAGNPGYQWTAEKDELLRLGYEKRKRQTDLCKLLGCSVNTMRRRAREKGWSK